MRLVVSLPTRGRPEKLLATVKASVSNWVLDNTTLAIIADNDDQPTLELFKSGALDELNPNIKAAVIPRPDTVAAKWNTALDIPADVYLLYADDAPIVTPGYDAKILEAARKFPDGIGMVYGHMTDQTHCGVLAPTAKFCEKMGYMVPEYFPYWFVDHWIDDICRYIGRVVFADVRMDKSNFGATQEMREPFWWGAWYNAALSIRMKTVRQIIRDAEFKTPQWAKDCMLSQPDDVSGARIESWSRHINSSPWLFATKGRTDVDERYRRVKQRAIDLVPQLFKEMTPSLAEMFSTVLLPKNEKETYCGWL